MLVSAAFAIRDGGLPFRIAGPLTTADARSRWRSSTVAVPCGVLGQAATRAVAPSRAASATRRTGRCCASVHATGKAARVLPAFREGDFAGGRDTLGVLACSVKELHAFGWTDQACVALNGDFATVAARTRIGAFSVPTDRQGSGAAREGPCEGRETQLGTR